MIRYFSHLTLGKMTLWCYLIWYLVTVYFYFDPSPRVWMNALGISLVIGIALMLSVANAAAGPVNRWQVFRLFMVPFCVSSFSSIIKGQGFILILPPNRIEQLVAIGACVIFIAAVFYLKRRPAQSGA